MTTRVALEDVLYLHARQLRRHGGGVGVRDIGAVISAVEQPYATFAGEELYPTLADKAAALGHGLASNHGFVDGNKRVAHTAMILLLHLNGFRLAAPAEEQERVVMAVAAGQLDRDALRTWVAEWTQAKPAR